MKVMILGAGITGLSLGSYLADKKHHIDILERTSTIGGMAKSFKYKKHTLDFGPHKIYSQIPEIIPEFFKIAGSDNLLTVKKRNSLFLLGKPFDFPVQIFQIILGISPFKSLSLGMGFGWTTFKNIFSRKQPKTYEEYFIKGFGKPAYNLLFRDLAWKLWGNPKKLTEELGRKRVPVPNVFEMLRSGKGTDSAGRELAAKHFYYPKKGGIGFISEMFAKNVKRKKGKINLSSNIESINTKNKKVISVTYKKDNRKITKKTDFLAGTIYLKDMIELMRPEAPIKVLVAASELKYRSLILVYLIINKPRVLKDNWMFFPERKFIFNRISEHNSFSPYVVEPGKSIITAEITTDYGTDIFKSHDNYLFRRVIDDLEEAGILKEKDVKEFLVKKAGRIYPVYDMDYKKNLGIVLKYLDSFKNFITLGRQGLYNYNNTDHCIDMSKEATKYINNPKSSIFDWRQSRKYFQSHRIVD